MTGNLWTQLREIAHRTPHHTALQTPGRILSYGELVDQAERVAGALRDEGLHPQERVVLALENSVEFVLAYLGILRAKCVVVPIPPTAPAGSVLKTIQDCRPVAAIVEPSSLETWSALASNVSGLRTVYLARGATSTADTPLNVRSLCDRPGTEALILAKESDEVDDDELAAIIYTSGTTGFPKGVMLSHENFHAIACAGCEMLGLGPEDRVGIVTPLFHLYGLREVDAALRIGATVVSPLTGAFMTNTLRFLQTTRVTGISTVPSALAIMTEKYHDELGKCSNGLRFVTIGTAPSSVALLRTLCQTLPGTRLIVTYGLTEASRVCYRDVKNAADAPASNVGRPYPGVRLHLVDESEDGLGRVALRSRMVMRGYWNRPEATQAVLAGDGALLTPDCGRIDEQGTLYLLGRIDEVINCGGQKVSPDEVEEALTRHPGVAAAAVFAISDPAGILGQVVKAVVVRRDVELDAETLLQHAAGILDAHKLPRVIDFVTEIPRSVLGKPQRSRMQHAVPGLES